MELMEYTFGSILEKYASETPDQDFMVYPDRNLRFSYKQFNQRVNRLAKGLIAIGIKKNDKVGLWAYNVPDWLTFMFASAKIGSHLVTINTSYKSAELEYIMKDADINTLCLVDSFKDCDYVKTVFDLIPEVRSNPRGEIKSKKFPELKNVIFIGQEKHRGMYNTAELMLLGEYINDSVLEKAESNVDTNDVVNMQYTSGTTGFPKGVMLSHFNILNNGFSIGERMKYTSKDRLLVCVPFFHCFGVVLALSAILTHGASMVIVENFDPLMVLASVAKEKCTSLYGVPTMFIAEMNHPMFDMFDISSLRTGIMAGALCPVDKMKEVMTKMYCKDIISVYGLTEASPGMTASSTNDSAELRATTVGTSLPNIDVRVIDPETGEFCKDNVQGELCCRGYNIMKGYYKNEKATSEVIDKNGWLHSGDLGHRTEDGYFKVTGRIKDMIIRGGENIYPCEIENYLYRIPEIEDVQVVGVPSPKYGEQVGAFIVLKKDAKLTEADVKEFCRGKIAHYKVPKYILFMDEFPMTGSGKIQKFKLRDLSTKMLAKKGIEVF